MAEAADVYEAEADEALTAKDYAAAVTGYSKAIQLYPSDPRAPFYYCRRSAALWASGDPASAIKDAIECIDLAPGWWEGYYRYGAALHALTWYGDAVYAYDCGEWVVPSSQWEAFRN